MATLRYKKRGNKWYVYELYQYWDKELKKPRQKSIYLGVADVLNGSYSKPGRRVSAPALEKEILDCGDSHALLCLARSMELDKVIAYSGPFCLDKKSTILRYNSHLLSCC
jgi:hypothetical protein